MVSRLIKIGGIGTIAAVLLVVLVLLATAWPLHRWPTYSKWHVVDTAMPTARHSGSDEYGLMVWSVDDAGTINVRSTVDGQLLGTIPAPSSGDRTVTCSSLSLDRRTLALGFSDGSFQRTTLAFASSLLVPAQLPPGVSLDSDHQVVVHEQSMFQLFGESSIRRLDLEAVHWSPSEKIADQALTAIDYLPAETSNQFSQQSSSTLIALTDNEVIAARIEARENMMTGAVTQEISSSRCPLEKRSKQPPLGLMLSNRAAHIIIAWDTGTLDRYALQPDGPRPMESVSGLPGGGHFTAAATLISRQTLLLGDNQGRLHGWNVIQTTDGGAAADGYRLTATHELDLGDKPLTHIASSSASHLALVTSEDSQLSLVMTTTDTLLKKTSLTKALAGIERVSEAFLNTKNDRVVVVAADKLALAEIDIAYPEATFRALFGKVWYEGHSEPEYIWQSTAGTEQAEPKLSLIPLIFGTLKATLYAMVFSIPLALLAAIYTSEFLTQAVRSRVKPVIELMASLPSVILGFIAALVLAPLLQEHLCAVLLSMFIVPATFVYAAHLWNLLPLEFLIRAQSWRLWFLAACIPIGLSVAFTLAPLVERWLFSDDIVQWMSGNIGAATGGWMLMLVPVVVALAVFVMLGPLAERNRRTAITTTPRAFALRGGLQLILVTAAVIGVSYVLSIILTWLKLDLRASLLAGYQERNSLLVGAVLGFCVIPLIYTLADDALQSVPQQLRSASLGCGATPWQTTVRVVVPSAMSGMFSAIMIGFGRAVGETMVVLMAAGNTPIMEWNPFNGFRTLSATLATELPEAAKGSTHFRTLFLAALLLFMLTLVANTLAELVRIRFRRRGSQL